MNGTVYEVKPIHNPLDGAHIANKLKGKLVPNSNFKRFKRSRKPERFIEAMVVADKSMVEHYRNDDLETYLLTVMNMVSAIYKYSSLHAQLNIALSRLVIVDNETVSLKFLLRKSRNS